MLFVFQATSERPQETSHQLQNTEEDDDVLCSLLSRHSYDVDSKTFSGADDVVNVQQINADNETQNTFDDMYSKSKIMHTNEKQRACDV